MAAVHSTISDVIFSTEEIISAFRRIRFSLQIVIRTALNMSEKVACSFRYQAVSSTLRSSSWPNRFPIRHNLSGRGIRFRDQNSKSLEELYGKRPESFSSRSSFGLAFLKRFSTFLIGSAGGMFSGIATPILAIAALTSLPTIS